MTVFVDGEFLAAEQAVVSVFDRSFLYGDGLFETVRVHNGKLFRFEQHVSRLVHGAALLRLTMPFSESALAEFAAELVRCNGLVEAVLRMHLSRGIGKRGYSTKGATRPTLVMTLHPAEPVMPERLARWRLALSTVRLQADSPLAKIKTANKLPQILARAEAEHAGADEALLLNTNGHVVEAASANLFWVSSSGICTPPIESGILPGITRQIVIELCGQLGLRCIQCNIGPDMLPNQQGVFLTLSTLGIVEGAELDGRPLQTAVFTAQLWRAYCALLERETA